MICEAGDYLSIKRHSYVPFSSNVASFPQFIKTVKKYTFILHQNLGELE